MEHFILPLLKNKILWITLSAWFIAQTIKVFLGVVREKKFNFRWFIGTGGMPSSHAAGVSAFATTCGFNVGFDTAIFAGAVVFAIVTMFDAQGVRRSTGQQAEILNKIMDDIYWRGKIDESRLKELIGHTPIEVIVGSVLGILIALSLQ
ncbi:MAG: divergent PAP2 family protein [Candidatus Omnitrophica bacterium]|nr:divergent PAP2 family protein [Candidatus Omnitrophota bacterium]MBM3252467.1 divergent PAP2 family protein [Candidatus Omnitrophota bacterium]